MSSNKQQYTDLDLAEDEFFAEFEEKNEKPSDIGQNKAPSLAQPLSSKSNFFFEIYKWYNINYIYLLIRTFAWTFSREWESQ